MHRTKVLAHTPKHHRAADDVVPGDHPLGQGPVLQCTSSEWAMEQAGGGGGKALAYLQFGSDSESPSPSALPLPTLCHIIVPLVPRKMTKHTCGGHVHFWTGADQTTHKCPPRLQHGRIRREGASEAATEAVRRAVGGGCRSGWRRLLSVTNAIEAGTWREEGSLGARNVRALCRARMPHHNRP